MRIDMIIPLLQILLLVLLLGLSGFFSSAEVAFFSLGPVQQNRLAKNKTATAARLRALLGFPQRLLSTILIGNTLVNIAAAILAYALCERFWPAYSEMLSVIGMTALLLVFGEIGPKRLALGWPMRMSLLYTRPLEVLQRGLAPLRWSLERVAAPASLHVTGRGLNEEEYKTALELGRETGVVQAEERSMVRAIIRLADLSAGDVMTPRVDVVGLDLDDPEMDVERTAKATRVRYLVLYRGELDRVDGLLDVRAYLLHPGGGIETAWREPVYVPETAPLNRLLSRFQHEGLRTAVVVDEYGGTAGILTRGDILEEITGEIGEENVPLLLLEELRPGYWLADAAMPLDELNERSGLQLAEDSADRVAGWVMARLERLPHPGDACTDQGVRVTVRRMRRHRIELVEIEKMPEEGPAK